MISRLREHCRVEMVSIVYYQQEEKDPPAVTGVDKGERELMYKEVGLVGENRELALKASFLRNLLCNLSDLLNFLECELDRAQRLIVVLEPRPASHARVPECLL